MSAGRQKKNEVTLLYYLNPNQMKPNCFTYCKSYTKVILKKLFIKYFLIILQINIKYSDFLKLFTNNLYEYAK